MNDALDAVVARADRALDSMHSAAERLAQLRVTRRSHDGLVTVTVDSTGALIDLGLAEDLTRESADRLASSIVGTASDAAREAAERRAAVLDEMHSSLSET